MKHHATLFAASVLLIASAFLTGCKGDTTSDADVNDNPAGAPSEVTESKVQNAALVECGYPDQDCSSVNLDLLKIKPPSAVANDGETKRLDCTGGRLSRSEDGSWDICKCTCVPASQIAKK